MSRCSSQRLVFQIWADYNHSFVPVCFLACRVISLLNNSSKTTIFHFTYISIYRQHSD